MVVFLGKGYALWRGVWVPAQAALKGGKGGRGLVAPCTLSPVSWGGRL
jgi:hypothetical protein